ncbi:AsmA family protein [Thermomonas brevis]|uniref:AsmA family protein n=1 Tax=Thermomonas brevis TaxID=215691 RepID=A0A7G9QW26_9GAMM|nr:AsmA family protein [Thermomonas brevis]QNN47551.1 AsmA family protein [Thermomonas brevis]
MPTPPPPSRSIGATLSRHPLRTALAVAALALVVLLLLWDWNWFKRPIERIVTARTGREFHIDGDLDVDLGRTATIRADGLRMANAPWAQAPQFARIDRLAFDLRLWPLLRRHAVIPRIALQGAQLQLERRADGSGNWTFERGGGTGSLPEFRNVTVKAGQLVFLDPANKTDVRFKLDSGKRGPDDAEAPIAVTGGGHWAGNAFALEGTAESPLELRDAARPYRIDARARAGATRAHARGTLTDPLHFRDFDLRLALSGKNLADLYPLIGVVTPDTPPYALDGRLTRDLGGRTTTWHYDGFTGKVGDSDLRGSAAVTTGGARPRLVADLRSNRLDFDDLAGFVGGAPSPGESSNPELRAKAADQTARDRLLPATPYRLDKLRAMDADVRLQAERIDAPRLPLQKMDAHLLLDDGLLRLAPLDFTAADGRVRANVRMDARGAPIRTHAVVGASGLDLPQLMPGVKLGQTAVGRVDADIDLQGQGNSIAAMLGSASGHARAGMGRGQISKLLMEFAGLDLAGILRIKLTHDKQIPIRCVRADFAVDNGVMSARQLVFDTTETLLKGRGTVNLRDETLDLAIQPRTKDFSPLSLRSPLYVQGRFTHPSFKPDYGRIGLRAGAAAALATLAAPAAALVATTDVGDAKDAACGEPEPTKRKG